MTPSEWSPHIEAAAEAMYSRLNISHTKPAWDDLDIDAADHYCIAAKLAVDTFHTSAAKDIDDVLYGRLNIQERAALSRSIAKSMHDCPHCDDNGIIDEGPEGLRYCKNHERER